MVLRAGECFPAEQAVFQGHIAFFGGCLGDGGRAGVKNVNAVLLVPGGNVGMTVEKNVPFF